MNSLLREDTRQALYLIQQFLEKGIPLNDIYVKILAESMHRVGDLWHTARISVAEEHYCTSVTQLAQSLDLHILAEGMETKEQADYLLSSGCTFAQGYLYGKPMPAEEFLQKY